jgi:5-methylcytosine-specific restriction endonuclease McrA
VAPGVHKPRKGHHTHKICKISGCGQEHYAKGFCSKHWSYYVAYSNRRHQEHNCIATGCTIKIPFKEIVCSKHIRRYITPIPRKTGRAHWSYRNGHSYFEHHYTLKQLRKQIIEERGYKCERCLITPTRLHIHHKDKNKNNHIRENLELLCPKCHASFRIGSKNKKHKITKKIKSHAIMFGVSEQELMDIINTNRAREDTETPI